MMEENEVTSYMQKFDPTIPFGSKLCQLQGHLNGFDKEQCAQVACHMRVMTQRLRTLAGVTSTLVSDRFLRLEALVATYYAGETDVPLSLQIWTEGQLRTLVPYLNGGRTPESLGCRASDGLLNEYGSDTAAASTDLAHVIDTQDLEPSEVPEYRVRRSADGPWEPASEQEAAEFRAHDQAMEADRLAQEEADRMTFNQHEATMAQKWDDWAIASELNDTQQPPSRKRVRITICAGTGSGQSIGEACIEGVIAHDQQATISFNVVESLVGGLGRPTVGAVNTHADPQLASYEKDHLPGLPEMVHDFLGSIEGRHWLWRLQEGTATADMLMQRFGQEIAEAAQLWLALQEDLDRDVRNLADGTTAAGVTDGGIADGGAEGSTSGSSTVAVDNDDERVSSLMGPAVARIGAAGEDQGGGEGEGQHEQGDGGDEEEAARSEDAGVDVMDCGGSEVEELQGREGQPVHDTVPDSLQLAAGIEENGGQGLVGRNVEDDVNNHECGVEIGAGLEDSALSAGEFERPLLNDIEGTGETGGPVMDGDTLVATSASSGSSVARTTESSESGHGSKQTDLKGWLK